MKKAYRKKYQFGDSERYRIFLKKNLLRLNPRYYSIAALTSLQTPDGPMYAIQIVAEIADPNMEPIAECWINDQYIYLWREHCWTIAVDDRGNEILKEDFPHHSGSFGGTVQVGKAKLDIAPPACNKTMIIHQIGNEPLE